MGEAPLYNSRVVRLYLDYLEQRYPWVDSPGLLQQAGLQSAQIADPGHWLTQREVDRFHEVLVEQTGDVDIGHAAGRHGAFSRSLGHARQYLLSLVSPALVYRMVGRIYTIFSRGADASVTRRGASQVQIEVRPRPGVVEKPFQCRNRQGLLEAVGQVLTGRYAEVEHGQCVHRGDPCCRYLVRWRVTAALRWKRATLGLVGLTLASPLLLLVWPPLHWLPLALGLALLAALAALRGGQLARRELGRALEAQGNATQELLAEIQARHDDAALVQELAQTTSRAVDADALLAESLMVISRWLPYERLLVLSLEPGGARLRLTHQRGLEGVPELVVDPEGSVLHRVVAAQRSLVLGSAEEIERELHASERPFVAGGGFSGLLAVPLSYKGQWLGALVALSRARRPPTSSDLGLLAGAAGQIAAGIVNVRAIARLAASEREYRDLVQSADSIIMRLAPCGRVTFLNRFGHSFFAGDLADDPGRLEEPALAAAARSGPSTPFFDKIRSAPGLPLSWEATVERADGRRAQVVWTCRALGGDAAGSGEVLCIGNDITELRQMEQQRQRLSAELERSKKIELVGTLAGAVAHDLNNALGGLSGLPAMLLDQDDLTPSLRRDLELIRHCGEQAVALVQDLLTLARRGVKIAEEVELNPLLVKCVQASTLDMRLPSAAVSLQTELAPKLPRLTGSSAHLHKALSNLVINALEAMPDGGELRVGTRVVQLKQPHLGYESVPAGRYVTLSVADTGSGIAAEHHERLFEPFFTNKVMGRSGTGLGLTIVWTTVKDHHGFIDVQSAPGQGTTFTLYFPVAAAQPNSPPDTDDQLVG